MARRAKSGLSRHPTKGFRISVGYYDKDERTLPKVFWLGHDPLIAAYAADQYRGAWSGLVLSGRSRWASDDINRVQQSVRFFAHARGAVFERHSAQEQQLRDEKDNLLQMFGPPPELTKQAAATAPPVATTLYGGIAAFLESFNGKRKSIRQ